MSTMRTLPLFQRPGLLAVFLLVLPLVLQQFGNAWVRIADMSLIYVMLALGLNIVWATPGCSIWVMWHFSRWAHMSLACSPRPTSWTPSLGSRKPSPMAFT